MKAADEARVIEARVAAVWNDTAVYFEQQPRPDSPVEFLAVFVRPGRGAQLFLNLPSYRYAGVVVGQIFVKPETGTRRARFLADEFAEMWRATGGKPLELVDATAGTLRFSPPPYIGDIAERDGWLQVNAVAPYSRDVTLS